MKNLILIILLVILSCNNAVYTKKDYNQLDRQLTLDGRYYIYQFCRNGPMAFSSEICGLRLLKKDDPFNETSGYDLDGRIGSWLSKDTLEIIRFNQTGKQPKDTVAKISFEKISDITLKIKTYEPPNGWRSGLDYYFQDFKISGHQICFSGVEAKSQSNNVKKEVCFNLGSISVQSEGNKITSFVVDSIQTSMDFTYQNSDGTITNNLPAITTIVTSFFPKRTLQIDSIEMKGIFKSAE